MFSLNGKNLIGLSLIAAFFLGIPGIASAASYTDCSFAISGLVTGAHDCTISDQFNDFLNTDPITVNQSGGFFSINDWIFGGKIGEDEGYNGTSGGKVGIYDFSSVFHYTWANVMLVFKDGKHSTLVGYLLADNIDFGVWFSPFRSPDFRVGSKVKKVSHISVYYTEGEGATTPSGFSGGDELPEPNQIFLFSIGLFCLALIQKCKFSKVVKA